MLPLVNNSGDIALDYFTDGLTESLINNLSQVPRLRVMARSTVFRYKGHSADPQTIGRQLGVEAVLTVTSPGARMRSLSAPSLSTSTMDLSCGGRC